VFDFFHLVIGPQVYLCIYLFIVYLLSNSFIPKYILLFIHPLLNMYLFLLYIYLLLLYSLIYYSVVIYLLSLPVDLVCTVPYIRGIYEPIQSRKANSAIAPVL